MSTTNRTVTWPDHQAWAPVIGDDLHNHFEHWLRGVRPYDPEVPLTTYFVNWLLTTPDGALALRRINDFPRQHALEFPDDLRPWKVVA